MKKRKFAALLLAGIAFALCACGAPAPRDSASESGKNSAHSAEEIPLDTEHGIGDQSYLYGMCYLLEGRT